MKTANDTAKQCVLYMYETRFESEFRAVLGFDDGTTVSGTFHGTLREATAKARGDARDNGYIVNEARLCRLKGGTR